MILLVILLYVCVVLCVCVLMYSRLWDNTGGFFLQFPSMLFGFVCEFRIHWDRLGIHNSDTISWDMSLFRRSGFA